MSPARLRVRPDWTPILRKRGLDFLREVRLTLLSRQYRSALRKDGYGLLLQRVMLASPGARFSVSHVYEAAEGNSVLDPNQGSTLQTLPPALRGHIVYRCPISRALIDVLHVLIDEPETEVDVTFCSRMLDEDFATARYINRGEDGVVRVDSDA